MATDRSRHAHGRSEIWDRPGLQQAIERERKRLGTRLREIRTELELSQEGAAELIGIHAKHLQRVELGTANVTISTLIAIAIAYKVAMDSLFGSRVPKLASRRKRKS